MSAYSINLDDLQANPVGMSVAPQLLPQLQQLVSDCNTNPDEIRDMIRMDAALSSMVLKTANSAFFNPGYHIDSIDDAIMHLGFSDVYQICVMLAFSEFLSVPLPTYGISADEFWRRSVACALAMEQLARKYGEDVGAAYTIGLLHGIGMVFIEREVGKPGVDVAFRSSLPEDVALAKEETEIFGLNHAKLAAGVMRDWGFSEEVCTPVNCQFEPSEAGKHERMACLISFAKRMIPTITSKSASTAGADPLLIALLHLSKEEYAEALEKLRAKFAKAEGLVSTAATNKNSSARRKSTEKMVSSNMGYGSNRISS